MREVRVFELLLLTELDEVEAGYEITHSFQITSVGNTRKCSPPPAPSEIRQACCDVIRLSEDNAFLIPPSGITYGLTSRFNQPLALAESYYLQTRLEISFPIPTGINFTVEGPSSNRPLPLVRFIIGKE